MKAKIAEKKTTMSRTIRADYLARVEGEGAMYIRLKGDEVREVKLKIFEPPRFFEGFLRGRSYLEAPDMTARICGICPVAYQMSSVHAMEQIAGVTVDGPIRDLRRLLYCGEWIESHALHIFMLHLPDFLGYESAIHMAPDFKAEVEMALTLKKYGNELMALVGGREIHPINVRVGGFYKAPARDEVRGFRDKLIWGMEASRKAVALVAGLEFPDFEQDYEFVAMRHPDEYPLTEGRLVSSRGLDIDLSEFENEFEEQQVEHSNALHCVHRERGNYFVGPLARYALNYDRLSPAARELAVKGGLDPVVRNPFKSIIVRAVEMFWAYEEALRIVDSYEPPEKPFVETPPRRGTGFGCSEAPRGICWHRYSIDDDGLIIDAKIVPPTSQNQRTIESDLREYVKGRTSLSDDKLQWQCEQAVRNYDPCISCATHFLKLTVDRG
ncbi:MAG: Ni/Fe hydrogenase subunit alpha [Acidobacteria bacterium]|uniref:Ni/Fe hydrogenase subunit alpha n=1 Tax=Candidatus Polarisedimenticola svalbardensis TaxID=2886004 RepID=A0A8J6Y089_9BACT|nr:Ni/Fe hydrogenase subunit alpha [Candidatus Polarisedimenticola svalbardensis]